CVPTFSSVAILPPERKNTLARPPLPANLLSPHCQMIILPKRGNSGNTGFSLCSQSETAAQSNLRLSGYLCVLCGPAFTPTLSGPTFQFFPSSSLATRLSTAKGYSCFLTAPKTSPPSQPPPPQGRNTSARSLGPWPSALRLPSRCTSACG